MFGLKRNNIRFSDREEAGILLADKLEEFKADKETVVVAIPRGGVPVGYAMAKQLDLPLELVLSKKIGFPGQQEFAIGAVTLSGRHLSEFATSVSSEYIASETDRIRGLLKQKQKQFYGGRSPISLRDKKVIITDDGVATGNSLIASIRLVADQKPSRVIVALPVGPPSTIKKMQKLTSIDQIIVLMAPRHFQAVGQFYKDFEQVDDEEVIHLLNEARSL